MSESRAIYYNNEWNEIGKCFDCDSCRDSDGHTYQYCRKLFFSLDAGTINSFIKDDNAILSNCPLPKWDLVRDYGPDEIPDDDRDVLLSIKHKDEDGIEIVQAYYDFDRWNYTHGGDTFPPFYEAVSWRHIL